VLADCVRRALTTQVSNIWITLGVFPKFLVMLEVNLRSTGPTNVALGLRHRHNDLGSPESLIGRLENYLELPIIKQQLLSNKELKLVTKSSRKNIIKQDICIYVRS